MTVKRQPSSIFIPTGVPSGLGSASASTSANRGRTGRGFKKESKMVILSDDEGMSNLLCTISNWNTQHTKPNHKTNS